MIFTHFIDAFVTYLCADIFDCFTALMDLLLKWKYRNLLGIDRLKACITIQVIVTIILAPLQLIFTGNCAGTVTVNIALKLSLKLALFLNINLHVMFFLMACIIV